MMHRMLLVILILLSVACQRQSKEELLRNGSSVLDGGNFSSAAVYLGRAIELDEGYVDARLALARANIGLGKLKQAEKDLRLVLAQDSGRAEAHLELARIANHTGKYEQAVAEAGEFLAARPGDARGLETVGQARMRMDDLQGAETVLKEAVASDPHLVPAKVELGGVYLAQGRADEARAMASSALDSDPRSVPALYLMVKVESAQGNADAVYQMYKRISEIDPGDIDARYRMGLMHANAGEVGQAEAVADALLKKSPNSPEAQSLLGIVAFRKGQYKEAVAYLQKAVRSRPDVESYYCLAMSDYFLGEYENALSNLRMILDRDESFTLARRMTGAILLEQGRVDDAVAEMKRVVQQDEGNSEAHLLLGRAYMSKGLFDLAEREFSAAIRINPASADAYAGRGALLARRGLEKRAEEDWLRAARQGGRGMNAAVMLYGQYIGHGESEKARELMSARLAGDGRDAALYLYMAYADLAGRRKDAALEDIARAKAADPGFAGAYMLQAKLRLEEGEFDAALKEFEALLAVQPDNAKALLGAASILDLEGRTEEAKRYVGRVGQADDPMVACMAAEFMSGVGDGPGAVRVLDEFSARKGQDLRVLEFKARLLADAGKFQELLDLASVVQGVDAPRGLELKARAYLGLGDGARAAECVRSASDLVSDPVRKRLVEASLRENLGDVRGAMDVLRGDGQISRNGRALVLLGRLHAKAGEHAAALQAFEAEAVRALGSADAFFGQGVAYEGLGRKDDAARMYERAVALDGNHAPALNNLASLYLESQGKGGDALVLALRAMLLDRFNPAMLDTLGCALLNTGHKEFAVKVLERAASAKPNRTVSYHLAKAYCQTGRLDTSAALLRRIVREGEFPERDEAASLLRTISM